MLELLAIRSVSHITKVFDFAVRVAIVHYLFQVSNCCVSL